MNATINVHVGDDADTLIENTTWDAQREYGAYVDLTIDGVTFFIKDAATLFRIAAIAATAAAELLHEQAEGRRALAARG